eukprot:jgi/Mesvir1/18201/Mv09484-RA.2
MERNRQIADMLVSKMSSIICLQEFWHDSAALRELYETKLGGAGYSLHMLCRTGSRGDGLLTAVLRDQLDVLDEQEIIFNDSGDRVALLLRLRASTRFTRAYDAAMRQSNQQAQGPQAGGKAASASGAVRGDKGASDVAKGVGRNGQEGAAGMPPSGQVSSAAGKDAMGKEKEKEKEKEHTRGCVEFIVVNTHLTFPHSKSYTLVRLREVFKIIEFLQHYREGAGLAAMPIVLCGDWNGGKLGQVYKFLRSQGFVSSYDVANGLSDDEESTWVSHRNHHGDEVGVDFIYLLNPSCQLQPLSVDWKETVFSVVKATLYRAGLHGVNQLFHFFLDDKAADATSAGGGVAAKGGVPTRDYITGEEFYNGLHRLNLTSQLSFGLTREEADELIARMDADGDGLIRKDEFRLVMAAEEEGEDADADAWARTLLDDEDGDGVISGERYRALAMGAMSKKDQRLARKREEEQRRQRMSGSESESEYTSPASNCANCGNVHGVVGAGCGVGAGDAVAFSSSSDSSTTLARNGSAAQGGMSYGAESAQPSKGASGSSKGLHSSASGGGASRRGSSQDPPEFDPWAIPEPGDHGYYDTSLAWTCMTECNADYRNGEVQEEEDGYGSDEEVGQGAEVSSAVAEDDMEGTCDAEGEDGCFRATDFCIKFSKLEPDEMGRGRWPAGYDLSDHAPLTSVFAPMMPLRAVRPRAVPARPQRDAAGARNETRGQQECLS